MPVAQWTRFVVVRAQRSGGGWRGDEALQLLTHLPGGGCVLPGRHAGRELPPPSESLPPSTAVALVEEEVHGDRADGAGHQPAAR